MSETYAEKIERMAEEVKEALRQAESKVHVFANTDEHTRQEFFGVLEDLGHVVKKFNRRVNEFAWEVSSNEERIPTEEDMEREEREFAKAQEDDMAWEEAKRDRLEYEAMQNEPDYDREEREDEDLLLKE